MLLFGQSNFFSLFFFVVATNTIWFYAHIARKIINYTSRPNETIQLELALMRVLFAQ